ncbi:hypothetical protein [uncultured Streptomyces sp.]|uniref:hypothetical protein n=1 Tax=uncultured Streptomyces sp. TaxID=174707 RepID=UPI0026396DB7|nr:hypothetical protein [uncultured Streptomyces sp.]
MPGDDELTNALTGDFARVRGPRHAAPRKSLLTKLHLPAGRKAIALAAMPTAVFVGMGLTPKLAMADDASDFPFAPGPCVTRSDEPSESAEPSASASPSPSASATSGADEDKPADDATATPKPSASSTTADGADTEDTAADDKAADDAAADEAADAAQPKSAADQPEATPSPSATKSVNPLDPLGVGDALKEFFDGLGGKTATPTPSPSATTGAPATEDDEKPTDTDPDGDADADGATTEKPVAASESDAVKETKDAKDAAEDASDKTAEAIRKAAAEAGQDVEELDEDVKGLDPKADEDIPDGAKPAFPCPTPDPEALAAAELEPDLPLLPDDPWILESSALTLTGLDYAGIVEVKTYGGKTKKVLKFTAGGVDIKDLHQLTTGPNGTTGHVQAKAGSTSTIRNGTVTMYTEELKGNLFGIIPVTFSPESPPPLNVPLAIFTDVRVVQAGQFGGTLKVPGLHNYFTEGAS